MLNNLSKQDLIAMMLQMQQQMNTLTEIPKYMEDTSLGFVEDLLPWSESLPQSCCKTK